MILECPNCEYVRLADSYYDCPRCGSKMEVVDESDKEKSRDRMPKFCPLIKDSCKLFECMFFSSSGSCTFNRIATSLDVLREGVPVIRLFERDKDEETEETTNDDMEEIIRKYESELEEIEKKMPWKEIAKAYMSGGVKVDSILGKIVSEYRLLKREIEGMKEYPNAWRKYKEHPETHIKALKKLLEEFEEVDSDV